MNVTRLEELYGDNRQAVRQDPMGDYLRRQMNLATGSNNLDPQAEENDRQPKRPSNDELREISIYKK